MDPVDELPEEPLLPGPDERARQPLGSPYAVPLSTLVAGAAVAAHDQVQLVPAVPADGMPADAGLVALGPGGGGDSD